MEDRANGYDQLADALGRPRPKPRHLRVVQPAETAKSDRNAVWRPSSLDEMVGQDRAQLSISMHVKAARKRGRQPGHVLLSGPPGLGKTSMGAMFTALLNEGLPEAERVGLHMVTGSSCKTERALAGALGKIQKGDVLFIDECHRMGTPAEEMLGLAMEDGQIMLEGADEPLEIPAFTVIGATTKPASLSRPLRDRFELRVRVEYYSVAELAEIVRRAAERETVAVTPDACEMVARVSRQTPRVALGIFRRVHSYVTLLGLEAIDTEATSSALEVAEIDALGLDERDREYLRAVATGGGQRMGLETIASLTGLDQGEVSKDIEPDLIRFGLVDKAPRGRRLTKTAYQHLWPDMAVPPLLFAN